MKIIQIISSLGNGGAEKLVVELSNELGLKNNVTIVSLKKVEDWMFPPSQISSKVKLIELNKTKGFDFYVLHSLYSLLKKEQPQIVHIHLRLSLYYFLLLIPFFKKINFYFTIHATFDQHQVLFNRLEKLPFYRKVTNICLSETIYNEFNKAFPKLNFTTIENGVKAMKPTKLNDNVKEQVNSKRINGNNKVFLFVGRLSYSKNIPLMLDVFSDMSLNYSTLIIIGSGPDEIKKKVIDKSDKSKGRIVFLGARDNVADYMQHVDAIILTSRIEGLPLVVLEALSLGLPILSTPVGGLPDIIKIGENGFLSNSHEKNEIVEMIKDFFKITKTKLEQISVNNKNLFSKQFSIKACSNKHENIYKKRVEIVR